MFVYVFVWLKSLFVSMRWMLWLTYCFSNSRSIGIVSTRRCWASFFSWFQKYHSLSSARSLKKISSEASSTVLSLPSSFVFLLEVRDSKDRAWHRLRSIRDSFSSFYPTPRQDMTCLPFFSKNSRFLPFFQFFTLVEEFTLFFRYRCGTLLWIYTLDIYLWIRMYVWDTYVCIVCYVCVCYVWGGLCSGFGRFLLKVSSHTTQGRSIITLCSL